MITHEIIGDDMQAVIITLAAGEEVRAEAGAMTYMPDGIGDGRAHDRRPPGRAQAKGGEGLFFATMTGPGRIWIQTLPFSRLADRILAARRGDREDVKRDFGGAFGAIGDLIGGE